MKRLNIDLFLLLSIYSLIRFQITESACVINYPTDVEISPIYAKLLGKYTLYFPYNGKGLYFNEGETIQGYCRTSFTSLTYLTDYQMERRRYGYGYNNNNERKELFNQSSITLNCVDGNIRYENLNLEKNVLTCNKLNWSVFDTEENYKWCEKNENAKTFLLAAKSSSDHHILAGICFNLNEWSLETITYNVTKSGHKINKELQRDITKTQLKAFQSLADELSNFKSSFFDFTESELQQQFKDLSQTNIWLNLANYELSSIVQGESFKNYFNEFVETLNIIWWRNLRLGNWKNFMNTLENYAYNNSFQVYTGTSSAVKIPSKNLVNNHILEIKNGYLNKTIPGYIWSYLTSTDGQNEDFIIVGYNSPFAEWFDINEVVFCPDICSQIPWLKQISPSFSYATAGIMFCCSPDFIIQTNLLHGFPSDVLLTRSARKQASVLEIENASENFLNATDLEVTEQSPTEDGENQNPTETLWTDKLVESQAI